MYPVELLNDAISEKGIRSQLLVVAFFTYTKTKGFTGDAKYVRSSDGSWITAKGTCLSLIDIESSMIGVSCLTSTYGFPSILDQPIVLKLVVS